MRRLAIGDGIELLGSRIDRLVVIGAPDGQQDLGSRLETLARVFHRLRDPPADRGHGGAHPEHLLDDVARRDRSGGDGVPELAVAGEDGDHPAELILGGLVAGEHQAGDRAGGGLSRPAVLDRGPGDAAHEVVARVVAARVGERGGVREQLRQRGVDVGDARRQHDRAEAETDGVGPAAEGVAILLGDADQLAETERRVLVGELADELARAAVGERRRSAARRPRAGTAGSAPPGAA